LDPICGWQESGLYSAYYLVCWGLSLHFNSFECGFERGLFWTLERRYLMDLPILVVRNILICLVSSVPGLMISRFLERKGLVRIQSKIFYIGLMIVVALVISIKAPGVHWLFYVIVTLLVTTLGIQRFELWYSFRQGRWWWLKDKKDGHEAT
jgi:hypothetical protein